MNNVQKGEFLLAAIMSGAGRPGGFVIADHPKKISFDATQNRCSALVKAGTLFKVRPPAGYTTYFTSLQALRTFRAKFSDRPAQAAPEKMPANPPIRREVSVTPAPRRDAVIIWPAHIKPVCRMMPDRNAVSVAYLRIGQPGFAMCVGGAA